MELQSQWRVSCHGGPLDRQEVMVTPRSRRLRVPFAAQPRVSAEGPLHLTVHYFVYVVSLEQSPPDPEVGPTYLAYPDPAIGTSSVAGK